MTPPPSAGPSPALQNRGGDPLPRATPIADEYGSNAAPDATAAPSSDMEYSDGDDGDGEDDVPLAAQRKSSLVIAASSP